jgi:hypothetical protein
VWWQHLVVDVKTQATHSCGDLLFSSHLTFCLLGAVSYTHYGRVRVVKALAWAAAAAMALLIIAARKHYTVDVVVAWYVVPLVYCCLAMWRERRQLLQQLAAGSCGSMASKHCSRPEKQCGGAAGAVFSQPKQQADDTSGDAAANCIITVASAAAGGKLLPVLRTQAPGASAAPSAPPQLARAPAGVAGSRSRSSRVTAIGHRQGGSSSSSCSSLAFSSNDTDSDSSSSPSSRQRTPTAGQSGRSAWAWLGQRLAAATRWRGHQSIAASASVLQLGPARYQQLVQLEAQRGGSNLV